MLNFFNAAQMAPKVTALQCNAQRLEWSVVLYTVKKKLNGEMH